MDIKPLPTFLQTNTVTDVYTNVQGLQGLKTEENKDEALKKVAQQFESMFINMMLKNMRSANAVFEKDNPFHSEESNFYRDMLDNQRSLTLAHGRGFGIADTMYRQMSRMQGAEAPQNPDAAHELNKTHALAAPSLERNPALSRALSTAIADQQMPASLAESVKPQQKSRVAIADSPTEFIDKILPFAKKAAAALGVDHLLLVAQSALETGWGKHVLADDKGRSSYNLFNIKGGSQWQKETAKHPTLEHIDGVVKKENADFRVYHSLAESFDDFVNFVSSGSRYEKALAHAGDVKSFIQELHKAGYATDPDYSQKVMSVYHHVAAVLESNKLKVPGVGHDQ